MTDKEKLEKIKSLADKMADTAFNMTTDASLLKKAMDEYHQFIINEYHKEEQIIKELQKEPVSEKKCMFTKDNYTDEDRKVLCADCKEKCEYSKKKVVASAKLELTLEDIKTIDKLLNQCVDYRNPYQEVLKRFKERKEK